MRVAVIAPHTTTPLDDEIGAAVADTLSGEGEIPIRLVDGDERCLHADCAILIGDCLEFDRTAHLIGESRSNRPVTALWQLHALPPPDVPADIVSAGLRVADALRQVQSRGFIGRALVRIRHRLPPTARVKLRSILYRSFRLRSERNGALDKWRLDQASTQFMMMRYAWLHRRAGEGWLDLLLMSTAPRVAFLTSHGVASRFVPLGYHPSLGADLNRDRDIDVLFVGRLEMRRRQVLLEEIGRALARSGRRLETVGEGCYGAERTELLNRAKISLNLTNYPWEVPGMRFLMSMCCGAAVVSERLGDSEPYVAGEHFVDADPDVLPDVVMRLLTHDDERRRIAARARRFVSREVTLRDSISRVLEYARAGSGGSR